MAKLELKTKTEVFEEILSSLSKPLVMPDENEIVEWVKKHGYYGTCTTEYHEGLEEGAKWLIDKINSQLEKIK